jgi:hypothetical protein
MKMGKYLKDKVDANSENKSIKDFYKDTSEPKKGYQPRYIL